MPAKLMNPAGSYDGREAGSCLSGCRGGQSKSGTSEQAQSPRISVGPTTYSISSRGLEPEDEGAHACHTSPVYVLTDRRPMGSISAKARAVALGCIQCSAMPRNAVLKKVTLWFCVPLAGRLEPSPGVPAGQTSGCASHAASEHAGCERRARMRANSSAHEQERSTRTSPIARMGHNWRLVCPTGRCAVPYRVEATG